MGKWALGCFYTAALSATCRHGCGRMRRVSCILTPLPHNQNVRSIYTTVFQELPKSPDRRFIIVEMAFFSLWWAEATQAQKDIVYTALANEQIEFVLGGWSMNDDAGPTYSGSANQLTEGHAWIRQHFNITPEIGWQIDPFGLSSFYPTMDAMMGFNAHVINRIHYQLKDQWKASKHLQFLWRCAFAVSSGHHHTHTHAHSRCRRQWLRLARPGSGNVHARARLALFVPERLQL